MFIQKILNLLQIIYSICLKDIGEIRENILFKRLLEIGIDK